MSTLKKLEFISLNNNRVEDISSLFGLENLISLSLGNNQITNVASISKLQNLGYLNLEKNKISDTISLGESNFSRLNLKDNDIDADHIKFLLDNKNLRYLVISEQLLPEANLLAQKQGRHDLFISSSIDIPIEIDYECR